MKDLNRSMEKLILKLLINDAAFCNCLLEGRKNLSDKEKVQNSQEETVNWYNNAFRAILLGVFF